MFLCYTEKYALEHSHFLGWNEEYLNYLFNAFAFFCYDNG